MLELTVCSRGLPAFTPNQMKNYIYENGRAIGYMNGGVITTQLTYHQH